MSEVVELNSGASFVRGPRGDPRCPAGHTHRRCVYHSLNHAMMALSVCVLHHGKPCGIHEHTVPPSTLLRSPQSSQHARPGSLSGRMQTNERTNKHRRNASIFLSIRRGSGRHQQSQGRQRHGQRPRSRRNPAGGPWWLDETVTTTETATVGRRSAIRPVGKHLQARGSAWRTRRTDRS